MLVLPQKAVVVKWHYKNKEWYESKGYTFTKYKDILYVNILDLIKSSTIKVELICDYCHKSYHKAHVDYVKWRDNSPVKKDACITCIGEKIKESNQSVYGVNSTMQVKHHHENFKNSFKEKHGVENPSQLQDVKEKKIDTSLRKYGVPYYSQTEEYNEKVRMTSLEKYGVEHHLQSEDIMKIRKETNLIKYGFEFASQSKEVKDKAKQTNLKKYGVEYPWLNDEVIRKVHNTNIKRYGFKNPMKNPEIKAKAIKTLYKNGNVPTSSQQLKIFNMLKEKGYKVELNYPLSNVNLDVAIFIEGIKIDLEYDGVYWHQDKQKDFARDVFVKSNGWKVLRIRGIKNIPSFEELESSINKLTITSRTFTSITLEEVNKLKEVN